MCFIFFQRLLLAKIRNILDLGLIRLYLPKNPNNFKKPGYYSVKTPSDTNACVGWVSSIELNPTI
jgi:hypothetical protein